jgi:WD40 repeat protein
MSTDVGRRFFIGLGSGRYRELSEADQLPQAAADIASMRKTWARFGYTAVLLGLGEYDSAAQIRQKLSLWSADAQLTSRDVVVLYFAGHGVVEERDRHYLLCWDSREKDSAATALPTEDLVRVLCQGDLRHLLVVLDTCAGGAGGAEAVATALQTIAYRQGSGDAHSGLWFLASARRKDVADDGAFVADLHAAVQVVTERTGQRQRYLDLTDLVTVINERFALDGRGQRAELAGGLVTGLAPFIPNVGFRDDLPPVGTDLEIQRRVAGQDLDEHFGPRSRGVEFESEQGLYFSGRERALTQLVTWLTAAEGDGRGRVVTGSPGCGKSAVLGRIVAPSIAWYRAKLDISDVDPATITPEGCVTAAVHARHKRLEEIVDRIADALGVSVDGTAALLQELSRRGRSSSQPVVIVIDALDEAGSGTAVDAGGRGEPRRIAREVLRPMSEIPGVRLLVGTRRELIPSLGPTVTVLDLDKPDYRADEDVAGYVRKVLLAAEEPEIVTPYRGNNALAEAVAKAVAKRADGVFLVARMTARSLRFMDAPIDVRRPGWIDRLPSEIGAAFDDFLARFGESEPRVRRMLLPLAFAEGHGLPRGQIWSKLGSALAGITCTEEDITWVLTTAQAYVAEVVDDGRSAYRLYHQALAEHLRTTTGQAVGRIQELIVDALISTVPISADRLAPDWFAAAPYVRQHLATHARAAGRLVNLIEDPGFLLAGGQLALLSALPSISSDEGRRIRTAYEQVAHRLTPGYPLSGRAADLQLSARRCGANALADRVGALGVPLPWLARWAWWSSTGAHRQLSGHTSQVECVATGSLDDRPIAVTGGWDKTARMWDLITQQQIGEPLPAGVAVSSVAIGDLGDYTVALTGGVDGAVRVWDLSAGQEYGDPLTGHTNRINAIAVRSIAGRAIVLTASGDGTARIWNLATRTQIGPALTAHRRTVRAVALGELDGRPIAVTGGDDRRLYIWDLSCVAEGGHAKIDGRPLIGLAGAVSAVALVRQDRRVVAVVGDDTGMLSLWDLAGRQQIGEPVIAHVYYFLSGVLSLAIGEFGGSQVVLSTGAEDARLWDVDGLRQLGRPLRGHAANMTGAALTAGDDRPMAVTVSDDRTARVWDLTADQPAAGHVKGVLAVAYAEIDGQPLALTGSSDGTARLWDLRSRSEIGRPMEGHAGDVLAVALGSSEGRAVAVTGGSDATVRLWDPVRGHPLSASLEGHTNAVHCLRLIETANNAIAITGSEDGTIRLWDIARQAALGEPLTGHIGEISHLAVRHEKNCIEIVAATVLDHIYLWRVVTQGMTQASLEAHLDLDSVATMARVVGVAFDRERAILLAKHEDNSVRAYDVRTASPVGMPLTGHKDHVYSAAAGQLGNDMAIATVGSDGIRLWELETGQQLSEPFSGDVESESSFAFAQVDGSPVGLAAFGREFRMWDLVAMQPIGEPLCGNDNSIGAVSIARTQVGLAVITGGDDGTLRTHALVDGRQTAPHFTSASHIGALATLSAEEGVLAVVSRYGEIEVLNLTSRQHLGTFRGHSGLVTSMALCRMTDSVAVVTGSYDGEVQVWDLVTRVPIGEPMIGHTAHVWDVCSKIIKGRPLAASASADGTVRLWDLDIRQAITDPLDGHVYGATAVDFGVFEGLEVVLTGAGDGQIRMWDLGSCTPVDLHLDAHTDGITAVRLETIGGQPSAITADQNGLVRAWDLHTAQCQAEVNVGSHISDIALTSDGDLCAATSMGTVMLRLNSSASPGSR